MGAPRNSDAGRPPLFSVLGPLFNLRCDAGHFHYSPTPAAFAGRPCNPWRAGKGCYETLRPYERSALPRNSGKVAAVDGLTTPERESAAIA